MINSSLWRLSALIVLGSAFAISISSASADGSSASTARHRRHAEAVISDEVRQLARVMGALRPRPGSSLANLTRWGDGPLEATRSALRARSTEPAAKRRG